MRIRKIDRRFTAIMLGLWLVLAGLIAGNQAITFLLVIIGLILLAREFSTTRTSPDFSRDEQDEQEEAIITDQPRADQVYAHALDSVRRAGLDPADSNVLPVDIGLIAFNRSHDPMIYRTRPVLDDVTSVQPFVQLRLTSRARGRIRFEISDAADKVIFVDEEDHDFERGRNLISPAARLPLHDGSALQGNWRLRVLADGVLIAVHDFGWQESSSSVLRRQLQQDGELIGEEARAMLAANRLQHMSLDELLADQQPPDNAGNEEPRKEQASRR